MLLLQSLIEGSRYLSNGVHLKSESFFKSKGYKVLVPGKSEEAPRNLLTEFYQANNMFSLYICVITLNIAADALLYAILFTISTSLNLTRWH